MLLAGETRVVCQVAFLADHWRTIDEGNHFLEPGELSLEAKTFKTNVNARDAKG